MGLFASSLEGEIVIRTSPTLIREAFEKVKNLLKEAVAAGLDTSRVYLMLDEVLTNIYRHGYKEAADMPIGIRVRMQGDFCYVAVRDLAPSFDCAAHASTRSLPDVTSGKPGGMGLIILNSMCESFRHQIPPEGGNALYLILKLLKRRERTRERMPGATTDHPPQQSCEKDANCDE